MVSEHRPPAPFSGNAGQQSGPTIRPEIVDDSHRGFTSGRVNDGTDVGGLIALMLAISSWFILPVIGAIAASTLR